MMITGRSGADPLELGLQSVPAHPGHPQIRNQHVGPFPLDHRERLVPRNCALSARYPAWRRMSHSALTMSWSSSTTSIVACSLFTPLFPGSARSMFGHLAGRHRNRDHEPRARRPRAEGYLAVMLAHYRLADREPHPGSLARLLGREERREQPRSSFSGAMPAPVSSNAISRASRRGCAPYRRSSRSVPPPRCIASSAFMIILTNTCSIWSASHFTGSGSMPSCVMVFDAAMHRFRFEQAPAPARRSSADRKWICATRSCAHSPAAS